MPSAEPVEGQHDNLIPSPNESDKKQRRRRACCIAVIVIGIMGAVLAPILFSVSHQF